MNRVPSIVLLTLLAAAPLRAQVRVVTLPDAIRCERNTLGCDDGAAPIKTVEQLANLEVRLA